MINRKPDARNQEPRNQKPETRNQKPETRNQKPETLMKVYLDNSATTAMAPEVVESMLPYFSEEMGNAQSVHSFGQRAKAAVEKARRQVAAFINAAPAEVVFVSGGTEADNLAIRGVAEAHGSQGRHIITTRIEHPAVLATCRALETAGFRITYLPVSREGLVRVDDVRQALSDDTILVSIMLANNETGTVQPIEEIASVVVEARSRGVDHLHFHTDAVQAAGKMRVDVKQLGVDLLSLSAHKFHGPKGIGGLYVRKGTRLAKLLHGGHHERDRRAGTENVPGIVGLGLAAQLALNDLDERMDRMRGLRDRLEQELISRFPGIRINGDRERRVPNISNLSFKDIDGEALLIALDLKGIAVSTGSACASGSLEPSHVLQALGLSRAEVRGSLRFSLSAYTSRDEIDYTASTLADTVARLREMAPADEPKD
jgi:cysteine desulfurase